MISEPNGYKQIKVAKLSKEDNNHIKVDLFVYEIKSTGTKIMDIRYATTITTIYNATSATQRAVENMIKEIVEVTTLGLEIQNLEKINAEMATKANM